MKDFLTAQEVNYLKLAHRHEKARRRADRIKAILLLHEDFSYQQIAKILLLDETTISRYETEVKTSGIDVACFQSPCVCPSSHSQYC